MGWARHSGTVVSLALLASVVGHYAVQCHFHRLMQSQIERSQVTPFDQASLPFDAMLSDQAPSAIPRYLDDADMSTSAGQVLTALQTIESDATPAKPAIPQAVPVPNDAAPLAEKETSNDSKKVDVLDSHAVRMVIEDELADSSREERDIWYEELKSLPAGVVRDLLQVRKQLRELPKAFHNMGLAPPVPLAAEPASQTRRQLLPDWLPSANAIEQACMISRHNLVNATTPGYKRLRVMLVDSYAGWQSDAESAEAGRSIAVEGCRLASTLLDLKAGQLKQTERSLDLAIDGDGFFVALKNESAVYTRCGAMLLDAQRQLCLASTDGSAILQPSITVPADAQEIQITGDGKVLALRKAGADPERIGQLQLARFPSPTRLRPIGGVLLVATEASGRVELGLAGEEGRGAIQQGCLEQSNVDSEEELSRIEQWQTLLKSLPIVSRPVTAGTHEGRSR